MNKPNLVIMPFGWSGAPFRRWTDYDQYNFDIALVQWSDDEVPNANRVRYHERIKGQKWHLVGAINAMYDLSVYEYIQVLDDDVLTTPDQIAKTFDFCRDNNLDLAQPAVVSDYHIVHQATRWIPGAKMHITDTVEMMADIHSQRTWAECMRHCSELPVGIGYNIEGYWQYVLDCRSGTTKYGGRVAVIDQYPVRHLKPVQDTEQFRQKGLDPWIDCAWLDDRYQLAGWPFTTKEIING